MRYDQPPYPCPGCERPRVLDPETSCVVCLTCPAQDHRGEPIGVLCLSRAEVLREQLRQQGRPVAEELDSMAGLAPRESRESEDADVRACWADQVRHRGEGGGGSSKGRRKDPRGGAVFPGSGNDDHRDGSEGDCSRTTRSALGKRALTSSVHSARLSGEQRRLLRELAAWQGCSESEAICQAVEVAHEIERARRAG